MVVLVFSATENATLENNHQLHEQANKRKKARYMNLTRFDNCLRPQGRKERDLTKSIKYFVHRRGQYPSLYRQRVLEEKKTNRFESRSKMNSESL